MYILFSIVFFIVTVEVLVWGIYGLIRFYVWTEKKFNAYEEEKLEDWKRRHTKE